jgi:hypothetical protein
MIHDLDEVERLYRRLGPANCWTGCGGTLAAAALAMVRELRERRSRAPIVDGLEELTGTRCILVFRYHELEEVIMAAVSQKPIDQPITVVRGDDLTFVSRVEEDLTGCTLVAGIFNTGLVAPVIEITLGTSSTPVTSPTPPDTVHTNVTVTMSGTNSAKLDPRKSWQWFLRSTNGSGKVRTAVTGRVSPIQTPPAS